MADTPTTVGWAPPSRGSFASVPYNQTYGGQPAPYSGLSAQIFDAMRISGAYPGLTPVNEFSFLPGADYGRGDTMPGAFKPNQAARYSFGGGGGFRGQYGLLGAGAPPHGFNPQNPVNPGVWGSGYYNPQAGGGQGGSGGGSGGPPPGTQIAVDGGAFAPGSPGSSGVAPPQMQNFTPPSAPVSQNAQDLAMLSRVPGAGGQNATAQLAGLLGQNPTQGGGPAAQAINQYGDSSVYAQPISLLSMGQSPASLIAQAQANPALWASWQANGINLGRLQGLQSQLQQVGGIRGADPVIGAPK